MYTLFIQHDEGDFNLEEESDNITYLYERIRHIKEYGGYWVINKNRDVFIPWHHVNFIRIDKE